MFGASKAVAEVANRNKFMQFLMDLNDVFGSVRDQVLGMDPLRWSNLSRKGKSYGL